MTTSTSLFGRGAWLLRKWSRQIWVRAGLFSVAAVATAVLAAAAGPYIPADLGVTLAANSVGGILNILAASMLAVTTFSLSIMVSAYASATSSVTPHSIKLLLGDSVAQNTLATFIGSFLFSIVGIIGLAAGLYSASGRIILFAATLGVILIITATLLRWIEQLGKFGRVGDTIIRVEQATVPPAEQWGRTPRLGARAPVTIPTTARPICSETIGHIQHIDIELLAKIAEDHALVIHLDVLPGSYIHPARPVAFVEGAADDAALSAIAASFSIGKDREFDQDPRFGLIVLSEIASRALSPAVNDPGTAIEVLGAGLRVLLAYAEACSADEGERFDRVHAPDLSVEDMFAAFFNPVARDGARMVEVQMRIQFALKALAENHPSRFGDAARDQARQAIDRARAALASDTDRAKLEERAQWADDRA